MLGSNLSCNINLFKGENKSIDWITFNLRFWVSIVAHSTKKKKTCLFLSCICKSINFLECVKVWNFNWQKKKMITWRKENIQARFIKEHKFWTNLWVSHLQSSHLYIKSIQKVSYDFKNVINTLNLIRYTLSIRK